VRAYVATTRDSELLEELFPVIDAIVDGYRAARCSTFGSSATGSCAAAPTACS